MDDRRDEEKRKDFLYYKNKRVRLKQFITSNQYENKPFIYKGVIIDITNTHIVFNDDKVGQILFSLQEDLTVLPLEKEEGDSDE